MRILFVIPSLDFGGAQTFLLRFAAALSREHEVTVYDIHPEKSDASLRALFPASVTLCSSLYERWGLFLKKNRHARTQRLLERLNAKLQIRHRLDRWHFRRLLTRKRIELINSHMYLGDIFAVHAAPVHLPIVSTFHGCYNLLLDHIENNPERESIYAGQLNEIFTRINAFVWLTKDHLQLFEKYPALRCPRNEQIYNGFEITECKADLTKLKGSLGIPDESFVYIMVARGDRTKGWDELIEAFLMLRQRTSRRVDLLLVGWSEHLKNLSEKYRECREIHFLGQTGRPLDYITLSHVGMLPTYFKAESLPNTVIEYLYCGTPSIATAVAELPNMLDSEEGMAGILVESTPDGPADVSSLAEAMQTYLKESDLYELHCKAARKAFNKFAMDTCIKKYSDLFRSLIEVFR